MDTDLFSAPAGLIPSSENVFHHSRRLDSSSPHALSGQTREGATDPDVGCRLQTDNPRPAANRAGFGVGPSPTLGTGRWRAETVSGAAGAVRAAAQRKSSVAARRHGPVVRAGPRSVAGGVACDEAGARTADGRPAVAPGGALGAGVEAQAGDDHVGVPGVGVDRDPVACAGAAV